MFTKVGRKPKVKEEDEEEKEEEELVKQDEDESDFIQLKNDLIKLAFEGEFSLPFDYKDLKSGKILDVGCGPGSWCIDLAQKYPNIQVFGVDNVDMFPLDYTLPKNCKLMMFDVLNGLPEKFNSTLFDVIHIRFMILSLTTIQYLKVIKDCWRLLKPGGYIEILETDFIVYSAGPLTKKMNSELIDIAISKGFDTREQANIFNKSIPQEAIEKQVKYRSIPIGIWGGRIGVLCRDDMINILTKFEKYYNNSSFDHDISVIIKEMDQYKSFSNYHFYSAQKPHLNLPNIISPNLHTNSNKPFLRDTSLS